MSVEQGVRFFRDEAFLEEASARREAERGTFDPSYVLYSLGKLMLLKLREDYKAQGRQRSTRCATSTTRCSATARCRSGCTANLMLGRERTGLCWNQVRRRPMPLYEYECEACQPALRADSEVFRIRRSTSARSAARGRSASCSRRPRFSSRDRACTSPTTPKKSSTERAARSSSDSGDQVRDSPELEQRATSSSSRRRATADKPAKTDKSAERQPTRPSGSAYSAPTSSRSRRLQVLAERLGEIRPAQREVDDRLQESELVAGVVADAVDLAAVDRPLLQQPPQAVGQLDLAGAIACAVSSSAGKMSGVRM